MKYPCPSCGDVVMAHPANNCADCHLAAQIVVGQRDQHELMELMVRTGQTERVLSITDRINAMRTVQR